MMRAAALVLLVVLGAGWITYVHVWREGKAHPLAYRLEKLSHYEPREPKTVLAIVGNQERALITAGPRSSTGYSLKVDRAVVERDRVLIVVRELDRPGRPEITYPYLLLVFPWPHKPIHVHWEGRT